MSTESVPDEQTRLHAVDSVLGRALSEGAQDFASKYVDALSRVEFRDIADHRVQEIRGSEAVYSYRQKHHTIWLNMTSPDFEALMMHQVMRAVLMEEGYPREGYLPGVGFHSPFQHLASLLGNAVLDPVVDARLQSEGFAVYDRGLLLDRLIMTLWLEGYAKSTTCPFQSCKWTLIAVLVTLDRSYESARLKTFLALMQKSLPQELKLGQELAHEIQSNGFIERRAALMAMLRLRHVLGLEGKILIVDGAGANW